MDIIQLAQKMTAEATDSLLKAAEFIPADKLNWSPGGAARGALPIVVECGGLYGLFAALLRGHPVKLDESDIEAFQARYQDLAAARAMVEENARTLTGVIRQLGPEDLAKEITLPWEARISVSEAIFFPAQHTQYHFGQLNYIQTILGDAQMH